jgi:NAD(P)H-hydrate epimerase
MFARRNVKWFLGTASSLSITSLAPKYNNEQRNLSSHSFPSFLPNSTTFAESPSPTVSYLDARVSKLIDDKLTTSSGFSFDQLMELAGFSVANAVTDFIQTKDCDLSSSLDRKKKILIICGPGNNGGDGLVAARHLFHFGFEPTIFYPKIGKAPIFLKLVTQCKDLEIQFLETFPDALEEYDLILDSLFGYSFQGPAKAPSDQIIAKLAISPIPVLSVDIPSGWHVEQGDVYETHFIPTAIISLTAPKRCVESYSGMHYLGGRFVPPSLLNELDITLPPYRGTDQVCCPDLFFSSHDHPRFFVWILPPMPHRAPPRLRLHSQELTMMSGHCISLRKGIHTITTRTSKSLSGQNSKPHPNTRSC